MNPEHVAFVIASLTIIYLIYYFFPVGWLLKKFSNDKAKIQALVVLIKHLNGFLFFGLIPFLIVIFCFAEPVSNYGLNLIHVKESLFWIVILSAIFVPLNYFFSKTPGNLNVYPQIRKGIWSRNLFFLSSFSWVLYLTGYEFLFRGFLFFSCLRFAGIVFATTICVSFYALVHIPKGWKEAVGTIPYGIVICLISAKTGSILTALFSHSILALSNEWFSFYRQPGMKLAK